MLAKPQSIIQYIKIFVKIVTSYIIYANQNVNWKEIKFHKKSIMQYHINLKKEKGKEQLKNI